MRNAFVQTLTELARKDRNVMLLTGDLGFGVLDAFAKEFPRQFLNVGVAEQNMTGLATGLALEGKRVFTYSICNFPTLRCLEHLRNDACYHRANVKVVAIGGGFSYGAQGMSHHATEDLAILRALPGMTVLAPGDAHEVKEATRLVYETPGACYLRIGRGGEPTVHVNTPQFGLGQGVQVLTGDQVVLLSTGGILPNALEAARALQAQGIRAGLYSMPCVKPLDEALIKRIALEAPLIVTVEEHNVRGGFGSAVAEVLAQIPGGRATLKILGVQDLFPSEVGDQDYLRGLCGLSVEKIVTSVLGALR